MRALSRCCQFDVAEARPDGILAVRHKLPPLTRRQVLRLSPELIAAHQAWPGRSPSCRRRRTSSSGAAAVAWRSAC